METLFKGFFIEAPVEIMSQREEITQRDFYALEAL